MARKSKRSDVAITIVKNEIIEIESDTDEFGGRMLALCGVDNASGNDDALAKSPKMSAVAKTVVKKEIIEIESDSDTDEVDGSRMLALCGPGNASGDDTFAKDGGTNRNNTQIVCADDCDSGLVRDLEYNKYLAKFNVTANLYLLEDSVKGSFPMRVMSNIDNRASDRSQGRAVRTEKSRAGRKAKPPTISNVSKRLKIENDRADHKSVSGIKETQPKKQVGRRGRKISVAKNNVEYKPKSYVRDTQQKKEDARRGRKTSVAKSTIEYKSTSYFRDTKQKKGEARRGREAKENVRLKRTRDAKSQRICRASKRWKTEIGKADHNSISKTIPGVKTKDTQRKKREALQDNNISVTKRNVKSKSSSHVKENLFHCYRASKKENEVRLSSMDKSYAYFVAYLRNSIAVLKSDGQVKPVKDVVSLSDPDIIAVSNHPFSDGGKSPFEANKDFKVIDLEDGVEPDYIFNSLFSKKLMEILRKPYDKEEFLRLYNEASLKRPLTRSRQLRNGVEIEYNIDDQLAPSYLDTYTDFNKKYLRYGNDLPRALNLLRGFFFYLENIVLEGSFRPWVHEKRLMDVCFDASEYKEIACNTPLALEV